MKPFIALVLGVSIASTSNSSDTPRVDCPGGNCPLVQVPKEIAQGSVKAAVSAPAKVANRVRSNRPVRSFLRKVFGQ